MPLAPRLSRFGPSQQSNFVSFRQPPQSTTVTAKSCKSCCAGSLFAGTIGHSKYFVLSFLAFDSGSFPFILPPHHPPPSQRYTYLFLLNLAHPCLFGFFFRIPLPSSTNSFVPGLLHISILSPHATLTNTPNNGDQGVRHHHLHTSNHIHLTPVSRIYKEIGAGERVSLCKIATEHIERHPNRPFRLAIDVSIWQFQIQAARGKIYTPFPRYTACHAES